MAEPVEVLGGIESHVQRHAFDKEVANAEHPAWRAEPSGDAKSVKRDGLTLQIADRAHLVRPEQLVAADMDPGEEHDRLPRVNVEQKVRGKVHADVDKALGQGLFDRRFTDVLHIREPLGPQQLFGEVLRGLTHGR